MNLQNVPATMLKNKIMYRQFIQCRFCKLNMLYTFKTFVSSTSNLETLEVKSYDIYVYT